MGSRTEGAPRMEQIKDAPWIRQMERYGYCDDYESLWRTENDTADDTGACPVLSIGGD